MSSDLVVAVGDGGTIETHPAAGGAPLRHHLPGRGNLHAVDLHGPALAVAVGEAGAWWRWNGTTWTRGRSFTNSDLHSVRVVAPDDVLVGAVDGKLWRLSGERAASVGECGGAGAVSSLWNCRSVIWGCSGRAAFRLAGQRSASLWELPGRPHLHAVCGAVADDGPVYAVGRGGAWRFSSEPGPTWRHLGGATCYSATCSEDGARLYVLSVYELREWTDAGGWRTLFAAPARLLAVALDQDRGILWAAGERGVYRHLLTFDETGGDAVAVAIDPEITARYEDVHG